MSERISNGARVRLNAVAKTILFQNARAHWREFRDAVGVVEGLTEWPDSDPGPELDVRWYWNICDPHKPTPTFYDSKTGLRYAYLPDDLEIVAP